MWIVMNMCVHICNKSIYSMMWVSIKYIMNILIQQSLKKKKKISKVWSKQISSDLRIRRMLLSVLFKPHKYIYCLEKYHSMHWYIYNKQKNRNMIGVLYLKPLLLFSISSISPVKSRQTLRGIDARTCLRSRSTGRRPFRWHSGWASLTLWKSWSWIWNRRTCTAVERKRKQAQ